MDYKCASCNKKYSSYQSLWNHNKKQHNIEIKEKDYCCSYCNKKLSCRQSKWRHEKTCSKFKESEELKNKIQQIEKDVEKLKVEPKINNINNITNNINKGVINNFFSQPGSESINTLNEKEIEYILDQELNSVIRIIEVLNFSANTPENHTFCSTAINDKHINVINPETTQIEKRIKKEFIEQLLAPGINKVKMLYEKIDPANPKRQKYNEKIDKLVNSLIINNKGRKIFVDAINVLTYNNRHKVLLTWEQIKQGKIPDTKFTSDNDVKPVPDLNKILGGKMLEYSDSEFSSDTECDDELENNSDDNTSESEEELSLIKIEYKKSFYFLDNNVLYNIVNDKKGTIFGHYKNGKVIVIKENEIEI